MDFNELLFQHQRALIQAGEAVRTGREAIPAGIGCLAERIRRARSHLGVAQYWHPEVTGFKSFAAAGCLL